MTQTAGSATTTVTLKLEPPPQKQTISKSFWECNRFSYQKNPTAIETITVIVIDFATTAAIIIVTTEALLRAIFHL